MCGRFTLVHAPDELAQMFGLSEWVPISPRYNIAPTQMISAVRQPSATAGPQIAWLRWGLVPTWATDIAVGNSMINARAETIATKPAFRAATKYRRCLVPASGYFEWRAVGHEKQPVYIRMADETPFAMAGLWEVWDAPDGSGAVESIALITTTANALIAPMHDRMAVIVPRDRFADWLDPNVRQFEAIRDLLAPFPPDNMVAYTVNPVVNNARHDAPDCIEPFRQFNLFD